MGPRQCRFVKTRVRGACDELLLVGFFYSWLAVWRLWSRSTGCDRKMLGLGLDGALRPSSDHHCRHFLQQCI